MKWVLLVYLFGSDDVLISQENFNSIDECGKYFYSIKNKLTALEGFKEVKCEEEYLVNRVFVYDEEMEL